MKNLVWYLFVGTRGGETRIRIVLALKKQPMNANQLAKKLNLDYKTIQHHLKILCDNDLLSAVGKEKYGSVYFVSEMMLSLWNDFGVIWKQFGKN